MEFTEAESNMNDLVSEYQQYQVKQHFFRLCVQQCCGSESECFGWIRIRKKVRIRIRIRIRIQTLL
jgi:hypothetical protein